jgi:cell division inhibitor SepF
MALMDKFLTYMKLNDNADDEDDYLDEEEEEVTRPKQNMRQSQTRTEEEPPITRRPTTAKVTPMRQPMTRRVSPGTGMEVVVIKPTSVEEAREITETLLLNRTVVLNLEGLDVDIAQRIIDFTSGSCFAISGNLQKISHYIFIVTPASVDISGDLQEIFGGTIGSSAAGNQE